MKLKLSFTLLLILSVIIQTQSVFAQFGAKTLTFDKEKFAASVKASRLGADILDGYAAVIIKDGKMVAETAGGYAIRGDDKLAKALMTTSTPNDIGSVTKMLTFIALLSEFERRAALNPANSVEAQLNQSILPYLPRAWRLYVNDAATKNTAQDAAVARIGKVTFRQLLSHKSGFRSLSNLPPGTTDSPFNYISTGIQQKDVGARAYNNFNATVITYLLTRLVDPGRADKFDAQIQLDNVADNDHSYYGKLYGDFYENWMQKNIFDKIQPSIRPSCDPAVDFPKRVPEVIFARYYPTPLGGEGAKFWSEKANNFGCHAQGGYYVGMRDLAAFMATFQATDNLVTEKTRKLMYDDSTIATQDARLGWSKAMNSDFATKNFGVDNMAWHGGDHLGGHTAVVQFPGGYIGVGTLTSASADISGGTIANALNAAWAAALKANFE